MRTTEATELVKAYPMALLLAWVIANRARYTDSFNRYGLALGEALLGDYKEYGMSQQQYRTAKAKLSKWGFATFNPTSLGTIAKLTDARLFSALRLEANTQANKQPTNDQRTTNERLTTNKISKNNKNEKKGESAPQTWQLNKDIERLERLIQEQRDSVNPDRALIAGYQAELARIKELVRQNAPKSKISQCSNSKKPAGDSADLARPGRSVADYSKEEWAALCEPLKKSVP